MNTSISTQIAAAYQQSPLWALQLPADASAGVASTAWTPVATEIVRHTGATASRADKQAAYAQVVAMLRRTAEEASTSRTFGPAERLAFGGFVQVLLQHYQPLATA